MLDDELGGGVAAVRRVPVLEQEAAHRGAELGPDALLAVPVDGGVGLDGGDELEADLAVDVDDAVGGDGVGDELGDRGVELCGLWAPSRAPPPQMSSPNPWMSMRDVPSSTACTDTRRRTACSPYRVRPITVLVRGEASSTEPIEENALFTSSQATSAGRW